MIQLKDIDHSNWIQCIELEVTEEQKQFVNPNIFSLAEAYVHSGEKKDAEVFYRCIPFAIYNDEDMVGFAMITYENEADYGDKAAYEIYRIMIDREHQGNGYGKEALKLLLEYIKTFPYGKAESVYTEWHPNNVASKRLFEEYDFIVADTDEDGAVVAKMNIGN
ncbi:MAG: GNAT family N-acetyltransferase [Oscillospiraceae bacterium]|nr:GNAT family N-acetyltransferase [Clostridia bacterium]MBQ9149260.1 GNAT family N-acetyltransferase [Oscillospiraceae bacterium]